MRDKIFQLYYTTKEKGSGIGLAMAFRAMQMHDGGIEVGGGEGRGTTFRLRFPVNDGAAE
ncbi:MAG: ATP-binding protein [Paludibaculum sp.]